MNAEKTEHCLWCKSDPKWIDHGHNHWQLWCDNCGVSGPSLETTEAAKRAWNELTRRYKAGEWAILDQE